MKHANVPPATATRIEFDPADRTGPASCRVRFELAP
jgi:hypothetical protein